MFKVIILASILLPPNLIMVDGIWDLPNIKVAGKMAKIKIAMKETNGIVKASLGVMTKELTIIPLNGEIERTKNTTTIFLNSEDYQVGNCIVSSAVIAIGVLKNNPITFSTRARIMTFSKCGDKPMKTLTDDISGIWKFVSPLYKTNFNKTI